MELFDEFFTPDSQYKAVLETRIRDHSQGLQHKLQQAAYRGQDHLLVTDATPTELSALTGIGFNVTRQDNGNVISWAK